MLQYFSKIASPFVMNLKSMAESINISTRKKIGEKIRKVRKQKKLSLRELEAVTGLGHSWLGKLENGKVNFEIDSLMKLAQALKIQLKELFDFKVEYRDSD
jgi:HTH-type transcriptional regulator, competence development regulator